MDKWRWSVFSGETTDANLNEAWWKLREELQGLRAPVDRSESDFDPGAKYHIPANVEYIRSVVVASRSKKKKSHQDGCVDNEVNGGSFHFLPELTAASL